MTHAINGRFLTQRLTGAQRYAFEVSSRLVSCYEDELTIYVPNVERKAELMKAVKAIGILNGHYWEQLELGPYVKRTKQVLWSPCNVGPLSVTDQVVTIHDVFSIARPEFVGWRFHKWYSFLLPRLARKVQHIITDSAYSKSTILQTLRVKADKVSIVPLGIGPAFVPTDIIDIRRLSKKYGLPGEFFLVLGSLEPRKNLKRVIEAWKRLPKNYQLPLIIAGGVGQKSVFGHYPLAELLVNNRIKLLGYIPDEDLPALYSSTTLFVYASLEEGFGLPPLEAIACGASVVTSDTSSMKEMCTGLATLVNPLDVASITEGIVYALQHQEDLPTRLMRAQETKARYNWETTTAKIDEILRRYEG